MTLMCSLYCILFFCYVHCICVKSVIHIWTSIRNELMYFAFSSVFIHVFWGPKVKPAFVTVGFISDKNSANIHIYSMLTRTVLINTYCTWLSYTVQSSCSNIFQYSIAFTCDGWLVNYFLHALIWRGAI